MSYIVNKGCEGVNIFGVFAAAVQPWLQISKYGLETDKIISHFAQV